MATGAIDNHNDKWRKVADEFDLGMDVGSVSVKLVVMSPAGEVLKEEYRRHLGQPQSLALKLLSSMEPDFPLRNCRLAAFTGLGGKILAEVLGGSLVNEVIAQARGTYHFSPEARTIIDMGGEDAKLMLVGAEDGSQVIRDFAMNTMCAAGTGSFLDQQAHRLGYTIEEFSGLALKSTTPPRRRALQRLCQDGHDPPAAGRHPGLRDHRRPLPGHGPESEEQYLQREAHPAAGGLPGRRGP